MIRLHALPCLLLLLFSVRHSTAQSTFANSVSTGTVSTPGLVEASGAAVSRSNPGVIWTHNDKGGQPQIFAIDTQGRWLGTYALPGAASIDYEDIAIGPGPEAGVDYLYLGDIGDKKNAERPSIVVYRIPEPAVYLSQASAPRTASLKGITTITLNFPGTRQNAETILSDPITGDLFIVTKQEGVAGVYRVAKSDLDAGGAITMSFVRQIAFDSASGGDISPSGCEIAIRQESFAKLWTRAHGQSIADALTETPVSIPVVGKPIEKNGEALAFTPSGGGYFTLSDSLPTQPLYYFARTSEPTSPEQVPLVPRGSDWNYSTDASAPPIDWNQASFDDSAWSSGSAQFGYGDGDEQTTTPVAQTSYFRKSFTAAGLPPGYRLELHLLFDDGAAVFLNGQLAANVNLPNDASHESPALDQRDSLEDSWRRIALDPDLLRAGDNTFAVEVHQANAGGGDLSFDAQLAIFEIVPMRINSFVFKPDGSLEILIAGEAPALVLQSSPDTREWTDLAEIPLIDNSASFQFLPPGGEPQHFYRIRKP